MPLFISIILTNCQQCILQVMESVYHIPTPKQPYTPPHESSRDDRLRVQILYYDAKWTINDIILQTNLTRRQVDSNP
jgi:hypothetical protein